MKANKVISRIVGVVGLMFLMACNDGSPAVSQVQGTSDGGGGVISTSTEAEIRAAVDQGIELLNDKDFVLSLTYRSENFLSLSEEDQSQYVRAQQVLRDPSILAFYGVAELTISEDPTDEEWDVFYGAMDAIQQKYESKNLKDYVDMSAIVFKETGPCPSADKENADASVSYYGLGAEICFSLENLKRIPRETLQRHITGLLAHEILHLFGFNETVAMMTQAEITVHFESGIKGSAAQIPYKVYGSFLSISSSLKNIQFINQDKLLFFRIGEDNSLSKVRNMIYLLGNISGQIRAIEDLMDEEGHTVRAFYLQETKALEKKILEENQVLNQWVYNAVSLSDETLLSKSFLQELIQVEQSFSETLSSYREIIDIYQSK